MPEEDEVGLLRYADDAPTFAMRAIARIAYARGLTLGKLAKAYHGDQPGKFLAGNVRQHLLAKVPREETLARYVKVLARSNAERKIVSNYVNAEKHFDLQAIRKLVIKELRSEELAFREGAVEQLSRAIEALNNSALQPALAEYQNAHLEMQLGLIFPSQTTKASRIEHALGLPLARFSIVIRDYIRIEELLSNDFPGEDCLWSLWLAAIFVPELSPFTETDADAIVEFAIRRLRSRGIDTGQMSAQFSRKRLHYGNL